MAWSSIDQFNQDASIKWSRYFPSLVLMTIIMGMFFLKAIFITEPLSSEDGVRTKLFKYEDQTLVLCLVGIFVCPLLIQPIVDFVLMPAIGYEYCEARTLRGSTFGFATYAYVPDPALCVAQGKNG